MIGLALYGTVERSFSMREEIATHSERYRQAYVALERMSRTSPGLRQQPRQQSRH